MRILLIAIIVGSLMPTCLAGDLIEKVKKIGVESVVFEFPSILHFDIHQLEDRDGELRVSHWTGRYIRGKNGSWRMEYTSHADSDSGEPLESKHCLRCENGETLTLFRRDGSGSRVMLVDPKVGVNLHVHRCNPFRFLLNGSHEYRVRAELDTFEKFSKNFEDFGNSGARSKSLPKYVSIEFDKEVEWQANRIQFFGLSYQEKLANVIQKVAPRKIESMDEVKKFVCLRDVTAHWREVENIGPVPCWIVCAEEELAKDLALQIEAHFFGIQTENLDIDRLLDKNRFTEELIPQDYNFEHIQKLAEQSKQEIEKELSRKR